MDTVVGELVDAYLVLAACATTCAERLTHENKQNTLSYCRVVDHGNVSRIIVSQGLECLLTKDIDKLILELKRLNFEKTANYISDKLNLN